MRLTSYSNYTMRVLMVAAARSPALSTIREVAHSFNISEAHLVKCVHQLGTWGYLATVRGNKGGFRLARPAAEINVGEVIRRTEDGFNTVECFDSSNNTQAKYAKLVAFKGGPSLNEQLDRYLAQVPDNCWIEKKEEEEED